MNSLKRCSCCKNSKPYSDFYRNKNMRDGFANYCKDCLLSSNKKWKERNPGAVVETAKRYFEKHKEKIRQRVRDKHIKDPSIRKFASIKKNYGLSRRDYESILEWQGGGCAFCKRNDIQMHVDHDHSTGRVRGILCHLCNTGLGLFRENTDVMNRAICYVSK